MWPALSFKNKIEIKHLPYNRGVWGKVHGASSDFRWIAVSEQFDLQTNSLEQQLNVGSEDKPHSAVFWRCLANSYYAIASYPSRAFDAAGRSGFLEKQVIEWKKTQSLPAAVLALLLLSEVKKFDDTIWWDERGNSNWFQNEFSLSISGNDCQILDYSKMIETGIEQLKKLTNEKALISFYQQLLSGQRPVYLSSALPFSPEALAVLLLPLQRELADNLSLAGWIPSSRFDKIWKNWDCIILPEHLKLPTKSLGIVNNALKKQAENMVEALFANNASLIKPPESFKTKPKVELNISDFAPNAQASEYFKEIYRFARADERRWLAPEYLRNKFGKNYVFKAQELEQIGLWANWIEKNKPDYADEKQWKVKVDLLRSINSKI